MTAQKVLNGAGFADLIRAGHARLKQMVSVVNSLNIFPVPDGDTGTNMELSLASGVAQLETEKQANLGKMTEALATGLLMGARGNSGVILSQLFRGFSKAGLTDELDVHGFAHALQEGVQIAYRAVAKPVEGTILTVAREAAAAGVKAARQHADLTEWMNVVCTAANQALARTPEQLPVLKQAGVVDSGGQGLVFIFEGFYQWLSGETVTSVLPDAKQPADLDLDFAAAHIDHEGEFGYCTEVLIRVENRDSTAVEPLIRQQLAEYGDSLLVVGAGDLVKVHVHTLRPGRVLEDALSYGTLAKIKIDNMTEQHSTIRGQGGQPEHDAAQHPKMPEEHKALAVVAVAAGDGLCEVFTSLGVDVVLAGGQTMNPSTEEIVAAVREANSDHCIVLPNNKNIVMAAEQAQEVLGEAVHVVRTTTIPEGIAAMMAFHAAESATDNAKRMQAAVTGVHSGQVVRAVRDSAYQERDIKANQLLGFVNQQLVFVGEDRTEAVHAAVSAMGVDDAELLTVFYGEDVSEEERQKLAERMEQDFGLEVELRYGGQPVYDYIFSLE